MQQKHKGRDESRPLGVSRYDAGGLGGGGLEAGLEGVEFLTEHGGDGLTEFLVVGPDGRDILEPGLGIDGEQLGHVFLRNSEARQIKSAGGGQ